MEGRSAEDVSALSDRPLDRDLPERTARHDLRGRLAELPGNHPSAADYGPQRGRRFEARPNGAVADQLDRFVPAAQRSEWREPVARREVERVGLGIVDERACKFQPRERRLADYLSGDGHAVIAVHDGYGREGRKADATVDGIPTEFKSLDPGASNRTVKAALTSAKGQARQAVIDGRDSGLTFDDADRGVRRFLGAPYAGGLNAICIIGDDYELEWKRG